MPQSATPRVSIGVPVHNGSAVIRAALEALRTQTFSDIEVHISDNCSSDSTEDICREFAAKDARFRYVRQAENIGAVANFRHVLAASRAEFFFWNAADDCRSTDFVEVNLRFLEENLDYVASTSPTRYVGGEFDPVRMGDASLEGTPEHNFLAFFDTWHANGRFYSLYRRAALENCASLQRSFFASDWAVILECCLQGKFRRCDSGWTLIGKGGVSQSVNSFSAFRNHWYERILPFFEFSRTVLRAASHFSFSIKTRLLLILLKMNMIALWVQIRLSLRSAIGRVN